MKKLAAAFPASFGDETKVKAVAALWAELLQQHPWITPAVFRRGVTRLCWEHPGDFLPPPAGALDFFRTALGEVRRATEKALPPPPEPAGADDPGQVRAKEAARAYLRARLIGVGMRPDARRAARIGGA